MSQLITLVATFAPYIYALCGLVALFQMYRAWQAREERRQAVFSYEREKAIRELYSIFFTAMTLLVVMGATYFTSTTLAKAVANIVEASTNPRPAPPFESGPTNTPLSVTPTNTPAFTGTVSTVNLSVTIASLVTPLPVTTEDTPTVAPTLDAQPTPTPPPVATPVPAPVAEAVPASFCLDPRSVISSPSNGQTVNGLVSIVGTATHEQLNYYKVEYARGAGAEDGFVYLDGGDSPVKDGVLITFDSRNLAPGSWTLRLVVVDKTGNFIDPPCAITILVG